MWGENNADNNYAVYNQVAISQQNQYHFKRNIQVYNTVLLQISLENKMACNAVLQTKLWKKIKIFGLERYFLVETNVQYLLTR